MIVSCPECHTKFNLPDGRIGPSGANLRCSRCSTVFHYPPPEDAEQPDFPDRSEASTPPKDNAQSAKKDDTDALFGDFNEDEENGTTKSKKDSSGSRKKIKKGAAEKSSGGRKKLLLIIGLALATLIIGLSVYLFLSSSAKSPDELAGETTPEEKKEDKEKAPQVIIKKEITNYYVNNEKIGLILVIAGKVVNSSSTYKEHIKVECNLIDENKKSLITKQVLCGNEASYFQLQVNTEKELESILTSKLGVYTNNTNVAPGGEVPFMVLFFNPPNTVAEFKIKVIDAKDAPPPPEKKSEH